MLFPPQCGSLPEGKLPVAAAILCVRGTDDSLSNCIRGLLNQNYPDFQIHIVIDSIEDPGWKVVWQTLGNFCPAHVRIFTLENPKETCSLKASSLIQAISGLDDSIEVVALIDADVIPYPQWLRDLIKPFVDPGVGATTGFRWYVPKGKATLWTLIRSVWNACACTQMVALHIPWGGSMALRRSLFRETDLLERWSRSFGEDTSCYTAVWKRGLRLANVPSAAMVNHEVIGGSSAFSFIQRQLISARQGHKNWAIVLTLGLCTALTTVLGLTSVTVAVVTGAWPAAIAWSTLLATYVLTLGLCLAWTDRRINRLIEERGEATYPFTGRCFMALPFTLFVYLSCLVTAALARQVQWRGITYAVESRRRLRMVKYRPYCP
jgi:hypothetical protein